MLICLLPSVSAACLSQYRRLSVSVGLCCLSAMSLYVFFHVVCISPSAVCLFLRQFLTFFCLYRSISLWCLSVSVCLCCFSISALCLYPSISAEFRSLALSAVCLSLFCLCYCFVSVCFCCQSVSPVCLTCSSPFSCIYRFSVSVCLSVCYFSSFIFVYQSVSDHLCFSLLVCFQRVLNDLKRTRLSCISVIWVLANPLP